MGLILAFWVPRAVTGCATCAPQAWRSQHAEIHQAPRFWGFQAVPRCAQVRFGETIRAYIMGGWVAKRPNLNGIE